MATEDYVKVAIKSESIEYEEETYQIEDPEGFNVSLKTFFANVNNCKFQFSEN